MIFQSILFDHPRDHSDAAVNEKAAGADAATVLKDLNLDQIVAAVTTGREEYELAPLFAAPLRSTEAIAYRHDVLHDLDGKVALDNVRTFAQRMRSCRDQLIRSRQLHYRYQKERWLLGAAETYCDAVTELAAALGESDLHSQGLLAFRGFLTGYAASEPFRLFAEQTSGLASDLAGVRYSLQIAGNRIKVRRYEQETDYGAEIEQTFERFKQAAAKDYRIGFRAPLELNHVEAGILDRVTKLYPDLFSALDQYCVRHDGFIDHTISTFDREVQFYVAYLEYLEPFKSAGLTFCYPAVSRSKNISATATFDLALADRLIREGGAVVCNDFHLSGDEQIIVVTGPNQGGKTTFARAFGQLHHLASLGCPVPGDNARLFWFDQLFTHFEKEEEITDLHGKLQDDLVRIHDILDNATGDSILIINENFTSTTLQDAVLLGERVLRQIVDKDLLCVCVTFLDELATLSDTTVSMVSSVDPADGAARTFKVTRRPADGLAYAAAIAEKYRLSYELLKERLSR